MELLQLQHLSDLPVRYYLSNSKPTFSTPPTHLLYRRQCRSFLSPRACSAEVCAMTGGKMVVELVGAFNDLTERMNVLSTSSSRLLFKSLKLCIPILQTSPLSPDGRSPLSKALSVAMLLADLQMDAQVISAAILREVLEAGEVTIHEIRNEIGVGTAHLLHESLRVNNIPSRIHVLDDDNAAALRKFCLTYYDIRALVLDLALKLDMMRHLHYLPRYQQQIDGHFITIATLELGSVCAIKRCILYIKARTLVLTNNTQVHEGESLGLFYAIHWMLELGLNNIVFELDAKYVVDNCNTPKEAFSDFGATLFLFVYT